MHDVIPARKTAAAFLLPFMLVLASCSGGLEIRKIDLPQNMIPFKDVKKKLDFQLPAGWEQSPVDSVIEKTTLGIRWAAPVGFRKDDRGTLAVWCDQYNSNRNASLHMSDVIKTYAPQSKISVGFEVDSPGSGYLSRAEVLGYNASHVVEGEKKEFFIVTVSKSPTITKMHKECHYMLFGRSASSEYTEEIKADISAIAATLNNTGEGFATPEAPSASDDKVAAAVKAALANIDVNKIARDAVAKADTDFTPAPHDKPVRWQVYASALKYNDLTGLRMVAPNKLLISIDGSNPRLLNTDNGARLWELKTLRYDELELAKSKEKGKAATIKYPSYGYVTVHRDQVIFRADGEGGSKILAVETTTGSKRWSFEVNKSGALNLIPFPAVETLLVIQQNKGECTMTALSLSTGTVIWKTETSYGSGTKEPPAPTSNEDTLWSFYDGVAKISASNGHVEWHRPEILAGKQSPPMQLHDGRLLILDGKNTLHILEAGAGKTLASGKQRDEAVYTNIFPIRDRIYLRGVEKGKAGEPMFFVAAVRSADGKELWADTDRDPSVSNLIDENGFLYFSTPFTVVALDRETGARRFAVRASDIGKSFPVQIRKYGNKIVYIGELVIAAFDAKTGAKVYRHGFDPVNQTAHMDALNESIESTTKFLSWFTGPLSDWDLKSANMSTFFFDQARESQNQSNYHAQEGARLARTANTVGDKTAAYRSDIKYTTATIDSAFSRAQFSAGMAFMTVENIQKGVAEATAADRKRLQELLRVRKLLYAAYVVTQQGDYAYRPAKKSEAVGISVIHLPSGRASYTELTPEYNEFGIFNLVDIEKAVVYHQGGQMVKTGNIQFFDSFFMARPVAIPK
jgi:outer membrane protein assembly factor BamB